MSSPKKAARARTERRTAARRNEKLASARARLETIDPGASPDRPIELVSPSQVDVVARSLRCPRCDVGLYIVHERGHVLGGRVCRAVELECRQCGRRRTAHFAFGPVPH